MEYLCRLLLVSLTCFFRNGFLKFYRKERAKIEKKSKKYLFHVLRNKINVSCKINLLKFLSERSKKNAEYRRRKQNEARRQVFHHIVAREYRPISIFPTHFSSLILENNSWIIWKKGICPGKSYLIIIYYITVQEMI